MKNNHLLIRLSSNGGAIQERDGGFMLSIKNIQCSKSSPESAYSASGGGKLMVTRISRRHRKMRDVPERQNGIVFGDAGHGK